MKTFLLKIVSVVELLFSVMLEVSILWPANSSLGACPEDPNDHGVCDTLYVEVYPPDLHFTGPGHLVRVPMYITNDIPDPNVDSIQGMTIPICFTCSNPAANCSLSTYWNRTSLIGTTFPRSIFRHMPNPLDSTWMKEYFEADDTDVWATIILSLNGTSHFWLAMIANVQPAYGGRSHDLSAIMSFNITDTTTICLDTCFWPPSTRLLFVNKVLNADIPRDNMPYCFSLSPFSRGDASRDGVIDFGDVVYLITYLYKSGPAPYPLWLGDVTCNGVVDFSDVVYLISYLYKNGPPPPC